MELVRRPALKTFLRGAVCAAALLSLPALAQAQSAQQAAGPVILFAPASGYDASANADDHDHEGDGEGVALINLGIRNSVGGTAKTIGISIGYDFGVGGHVLRGRDRVRSRSAFIGLGLALDADISGGEVGEEIEEVLILNRIFGTNITGMTSDNKPDISLSVRAGTWLGETNKAYVLGGLALRNQEPFLGVGLEHNFGKFVASAEYRYLMKDHANAVSIGGGFRF